MSTTSDDLATSVKRVCTDRHVEFMADWVDAGSNLATAARVSAHGFPTFPDNERQND